MNRVATYNGCVVKKEDALMEFKWLNEYHKHVYEVVEPLLENKEEKEWLREATAEI